MPQALTNTNISATYKGVLHTNGTTIPTTGQEIVSDGTGVISALSVGRLDQGATVSGALSATDIIAGELTMPNTNGSLGQVVALTSSGVLGLKSLSELIAGTTLTNGTYYNPKITVSGGVITALESRPTISLFDTPVNVYDFPRQSVNSFLAYTYPNLGDQLPVTINNSNINWNISSTIDGVTYSTIPDGVKYAIISTDLFMQSNGADYQLSYSIGNVEVARGEVREDHRYYGVDTVVNTNQQFVKIPVPNYQSSTLFKLTTLSGTTKDNALNIASLKVTVVGWIY